MRMEFVKSTDEVVFSTNEVEEELERERELQEKEEDWSYLCSTIDDDYMDWV